MKIAIYQIEDSGNAQQNIEKARSAISKNKADFFVLPEFFTIPGGDYTKGYTLKECYEETSIPAFKMLKQVSREFDGYLIGGSILEEDDGIYYNTCYVFREGEIVTKYRKINITREEVDLNITPGEDIVTFSSEYGNIGLMICADSISKETANEVASRSDIVFLPVSLTDPNHPKMNGHPMSCLLAKTHGTIIVKITRVGTFGGKKLANSSAIVTPMGVFCEVGEEEALKVVELPDYLLKRNGNA